MTIQVSTQGQQEIIVLEGRLDTNTSGAFAETIGKIPAEVTELIIDMKDLAYISSAGLRVLLTALKKMKKLENGSMIIKNVNELNMEVFTATGFADILTIENAE